MGEGLFHGGRPCLDSLVINSHIKSCEMLQPVVTLDALCDGKEDDSVGNVILKLVITRVKT